MVATCKTCRFWGDKYDWKREDSKTCTMAVDLADGQRRIDTNGIGSQDSENWKSVVFTGPEFGCVLHENV